MHLSMSMHVHAHVCVPASHCRPLRVRSHRATDTSSINLMLRQILTAIFLGTTHGFGPLPEADRSLTASDRSLTASDRSLTDSDRSLTASARSWTPKPERPAGAEAEAIQRDSFEYPPVSEFVAPSDFWLNFVAERYRG